MLIPPGKRVCVPLDIAIHPPTGTYAHIAPHSSMAVRHHIDVKAGVIDSDYTGNVKVVLQNNGSQPYQVQQGDRIAQMILQSIHTPTASELTTLQPTQRGQNGFGSTGLSTIHQTHTKSNQV
jgi:dUTP pyrophosphatase